MNSNWSYSPETAKLGVDLCDLDFWPLTLTFCMDVTFVIGNNSWKFHDDTMKGTWWKTCDGRTDRQTDRRTDGLNQTYSCLVAAKNNRAHFLCYFKLFASFRSHWWIQTGVAVRKRLIWVNIDAFFSRVTLKFDGWPSKTIGHLFYATSSFVQHFIAIGELKLGLQSGNALSGSNATFFRAVWTWNLMDDLEKQ